MTLNLLPYGTKLKGCDIKLKRKEMYRKPRLSLCWQYSSPWWLSTFFFCNREVEDVIFADFSPEAQVCRVVHFKSSFFFVVFVVICVFNPVFSDTKHLLLLLSSISSCYYANPPFWVLWFSIIRLVSCPTWGIIAPWALPFLTLHKLLVRTGKLAGLLRITKRKLAGETCLMWLSSGEGKNRSTVNT